jgi:hypothetical protein
LLDHIVNRIVENSSSLVKATIRHDYQAIVPSYYLQG